MISLTEEEEKTLDKGYLKCVKGNQTFTIDSKNIICYGPIDFHTNSEDYNIIEQKNWFDSLPDRGVVIPANYDYEEHCCYSPTKRYLTYDSTNPAIISQYIHGRLGKPERCCIFKETKHGI